MDIADRALRDIETIERLVPRANTEPDAKPTGRCLWCDKYLRKKGQRWCDSHCRDQWEREQKLIRR